jgi:hypothetical protein
MYRVPVQPELFNRSRYLVQVSHKPPSWQSDSYRRWWCSPRHDRQKYEVLVRQQFKCGYCGDLLNTRWFDLHHTSYDNLGYEEASDLVAVHRRCHRQLEDQKRLQACGCRAA